MDSTHKFLTSTLASLFVGATSMVSLQAEAPSAQPPVESKKTKSVKKTASKAKNDKAQENPTEEETEEEPTESTDAESENTGSGGGGGGGSGTGATEPNAAPRIEEDTGVESSLDFAPHWRGFAAPHATNAQSRSQRSEASGKPGAKTSGSTPGSRKSSTTSASAGNQGGNSSGGLVKTGSGSVTVSNANANNYWSGSTLTLNTGNNYPVNLGPTGLVPIGAGNISSGSTVSNLTGGSTGSLTRRFSVSNPLDAALWANAQVTTYDRGELAAANLGITPIGGGLTLTSPPSTLTPQGSINQWFFPTLIINGTSATQSYSSGTISSINTLPVPEPSSALLLGSVALLATRRRRSN